MLIGIYIICRIQLALIFQTYGDLKAQKAVQIYEIKEGKTKERKGGRKEGRKEGKNAKGVLISMKIF